MDSFGAEYMLQDATGAGLAAPAAREAMARWRDAGGTHAAVVTMGLGYRTADEHLAHLAACRGGG